jgi:DNA polymerase III sliding clamp (beta) subunit (PCNA family)
MTQQIQVLREVMISRLAGIKEDNVSIAGVAINRRKLLDVLKLQTQPDASMLNIQYGTVSFHDGYTHKWTGDTWHESDVINEPCIQISCDHTVMRFLNKPKTNWHNIEMSTPIPLNFIDRQDYKPPVLSGALIDIPELLNALTFTLSCVAVEETRPALQCVLFESNKGELKLASADGFRLAIAPINVKGITADKSLIHMDDCKRLITFLKSLKPTGHSKYNRDYPELYFNNDKQAVTFSTTTDTITLTKRELQFPDYSKIVPKDDTIIEFISDDMAQAIKSIASTAKENSNIIRMEFKQGFNDGVNNVIPGKIVLSAKCVDRYCENNISEDNISKAECDARVAADCKIGVNATYLLGLLKHFKNAVIKISVTNPSSPMLFHLPDNKTAVIAPMFVQW